MMSNEFDRVEIYCLRWNNHDGGGTIYGGVRSIFEAYLALRKDSFHEDIRAYVLPTMAEVDMKNFPFLKGMIPENHSQTLGG